MKGPDNLRNKLNKQQYKTKELSGTNNLSWHELFNDHFMKHYSSYGTWNAFIEASGFMMESAQDFQKIPEEEWNEFVKKSTNFNSWEDMLREATHSWLKSKLGLRGVGSK